MRPSKTMVKEKSSGSRAPASGKENIDNDVSLKRAICPALALPDNPDVRVCVCCYASLVVLKIHIQESIAMIAAMLLYPSDGNSSLLVSAIL